ncbi:MAG: hypothetical protein HYT78_02740, partial [Deltaproteobacteria bacterium]|nr:hypothetical protein [Deltaproteobacteria bacterium]
MQTLRKGAGPGLDWDPWVGGKRALCSIAVLVLALVAGGHALGIVPERDHGAGPERAEGRIGP